ncbi:odorant receptor 13a-like isoform X2 [Linepithema humile]|uniref:odorant receptor 13a-like isoform X2 n=1 Tax=Linepithema humile TaxID=83485 RepID=UPI00351F7E64
MLQNKYQDIVLYITQPTRNILLTLGAWPSISSERSINSKICKFLLIFASYFLLSFDTIPCLLYCLVEKTMRGRLQTIPFLLYDLMSASQYSIFIFRYSQLRRCLKHVEEDWQNVLSTDTRNIMLKFAKKGKRLATICALFMYSNVFTFRTVLPLLQERIVADQNITISLAGYVVVSIVICACGLTATFVVHACGQLKIFVDLLKSLVQKQWEEEYEMDKRLAEIVEHHIRVRSFLRLVQKTLQEIYLMEIMVNTITICLMVYFMTMDWQNRSIGVVCMYLLSIMNVTIHIFLFCYTGEQLTIQADIVATESCELEWYRLPDKKARNVVLLMLMSTAPTKISVGNVVDLSFETFGNVVKTAGAYFNMLRNVIE